MFGLSKHVGSGFKLATVAVVILVAGGCASAKKEKAEMAAPAEPAMQIIMKEKVLDATELFGFGSATLSSGGKATLDELLNKAGAAKTKVRNVSVIGHTDRIGDDDYNMNLSEQRANSVADYMVGKGAPAGSITRIGKGESEPVVQCDNAANWKALVECLAPNRRVVVEYGIVIEEEVIIEN